MDPKQEEQHRLELETLRIEHKALTQEYDLFIVQKDKEIKQLAKDLSEKTGGHVFHSKIEWNNPMPHLSLEEI